MTRSASYRPLTDYTTRWSPQAVMQSMDAQNLSGDMQLIGQFVSQALASVIAESIVFGTSLWSLFGVPTLMMVTGIWSHFSWAF